MNFKQLKSGANYRVDFKALFKCGRKPAFKTSADVRYTINGDCIKRTVEGDETVYTLKDIPDSSMCTLESIWYNPSWSRSAWFRFGETTFNLKESEIATAVFEEQSS